jgi:methyl-accepting chemotaxis protein
MNWFKNLNATPRLMSSFGIVIALTLVISYLGVSGLSKSNDRINVLYNDDMTGSAIANDIETSRMEAGRQLRDAMINIKDPAIVAADKKVVLSDFAKIHASLDGADKSFYSKEGVAVIEQLREELPAYEKAYRDCLDRIDAKDASGAKAMLYTAIPPVSKSFNEDVEKAQAIKKTRAEEKFEANGEAYTSARMLVISASTLTLAFGLILSFVIARGFSVPLSKAVEALERVAGGDLTVSLDVYTNDEMGRMANALNRAIEGLNNTMQEVADSAANASSSSEQLASASEAIASGAQEQAASLEETSASLEEITATVRHRPANWPTDRRMRRCRARKLSRKRLPRWQRSTCPRPRSRTSFRRSTRLPSRPICWP